MLFGRPPVILDCLRLAGPTNCVEFATIAPRPLDVDFLLFLLVKVGACFGRYLNDLLCVVLIGETLSYVPESPPETLGLKLEVIGYWALPWIC